LKFLQWKKLIFGVGGILDIYSIYLYIVIVIVYTYGIYLWYILIVYTYSTFRPQHL
jgi:hypothetical protein